VKTWPPDVERVAAALRRAGVESRLEEFGGGTPTAEDAARAAGCELGQIVKSLVFALPDGRHTLVMVPGDRRADRQKIAQALGVERAKPAGPDAPFPLTAVESVLMERMLLTQEVVWIGAGSERHMAAITPPDLVKVARARVIDAVSDNT
jgi:prolyl-tRNA editing enzyme YbaK/EbsC (Cys-tRNA(Pro) deacylase)